jgi:hypothetical protein
MIRITTAEKIQFASPDQTWSLTPGANHFESDMPDAVEARLSTLQSEGAITIETLDGNGGANPWQPSGVTKQ